MPRKTKTESKQARWRRLNPWARHVEFARRRCSDPAHKSWKSHGGKGIKVYLTATSAKILWERDNAAAMKKPSLDRVDPTKDYTLENCRFLEHGINSQLPHDPELRRTMSEEERECLPAWVTEGLQVYA